MVLGIVVATVARSCWTTVIMADALVTVSVSVTVRVLVVVVVTVEGSAFLSGGPLGVGVSFAVGKGLGVAMSFAGPIMPGVGMSLLIPGMLGDGMSFAAAAGTLGAAVSFPAPLLLPFLGDKADPRDPRTERGNSLIMLEGLVGRLVVYNMGFWRGCWR